MKKNPSVAKKIASVTAGTVLAASLYANAVYQPRNQSALESALNNELQAVVAGEAGVQAIGDGFVVTERVASSSPLVEDQLIQEIDNDHGGLVIIIRLEVWHVSTPLVMPYFHHSMIQNFRF